MFNIEDILSGDYSKYPEEVQTYMIDFNEKLRKNIQEELTKDIADKIMKDIDQSKEYFMNVLTDLLEKGCKGYESMSTRALLNTYLAKKSEEDFIKLMDKVNCEMEEQ